MLSAPTVAAPVPSDALAAASRPALPVEIATEQQIHDHAPAGLSVFRFTDNPRILVLASGVLSELCLRHLAVSRKVPAAIHAGSPYLMGISLSNRKRRLPSFSVEVEDLVAGKPLDKRCYFLKLPAGRTQETAYRHQLSKRGRHQLTGFRLSTKFPFGLIQKSRDVADARELLIYPALVRVPGRRTCASRGNTTLRTTSPTRPPPVIAAPTDTAIKIMAAAWALRSCS